MASKVLVPSATFTKIQQVKKSPPAPVADTASCSGSFVSSNDPGTRIAHLEHSVRFLQEQHRLMLGGLHSEIDALRERNRDLQFQLIFNKDFSSKQATSTNDEVQNDEEIRLKEEIKKLENETATAKNQAKLLEEKSEQLQILIDSQADKIRELELRQCPKCSNEQNVGPEGPGSSESRAELRARLSEAERLIRRLRADADRQRREVHGGVTNFIFDGAAAAHAHLQCMKNSLQASMRAAGVDPGFAYPRPPYHFPPVHTPDFWREPLREEYNVMGSRNRNSRRPLTLPELTAAGQQVHRSNVYVNHHTRPRANGYEQHKGKKPHANNGDNYNGKPPEEVPMLNGQGLGPRPRRHHRRQSSTENS